MSGGSGQMPMASNAGQQQQQMQQPMMGQMGMQPQGMMGGQPQIAQQMVGSPALDQAAFQQMMQAQQMQGGMQPATGIASLGGQVPMGFPMEYATPRTQSDMNPYQQNPNQVDMRPTNMQQQQSAPPLPGAGMPPGYRPTSGTIDGRHLRDMMDIYRSRFMEGGPGDGRRDRNRLPGAIGNDLPPSLKRPTQGNYKGFK